MIISIISALAHNRVIGKKNDLPWYLPADLKHFKETTTGKTIVMGLNTFKSIGAKPLQNRTNIILSKEPIALPEGCLWANSIDQALELSKDQPELMVCGGAMIYSQFLPLAHKMYLTYIDADIEGDIFFPEFNIDEWKEVSREDHQPDEKNKYPYSFVVLERKL